MGRAHRGDTLSSLLIVSLAGCSWNELAPSPVGPKVALEIRIAESEVVVCGSVETVRRSTKVAWTHLPNAFEAREVAIDFVVATVVKGTVVDSKIRFYAFEAIRSPLPITAGPVIVFLRRDHSKLRIHSDYRDLGLALPVHSACNPINHAERNPLPAIAETVIPVANQHVDWKGLKQTLLELRPIVPPLWFSNGLEKAVNDAGTTQFPDACFASVAVFPETDRCLDQIDGRFSAVDVEYAAMLKTLRNDRRATLIKQLSGRHCCDAASTATSGHERLASLRYLAEHHLPQIRSGAATCLERLRTTGPVQ